MAKSESREKRRTQSLKGRESFQLSKEVEDKLVDLEHKMAALGTSSSAERGTVPLFFFYDDTKLRWEVTSLLFLSTFDRESAIARS